MSTSIKILTTILLLMNFIISSCSFTNNNDYDGLRTGTFELYENKIKIGNIYRKNNLQIERYYNLNDLYEAELKWINDSTLHIRGTEKNQVGVDTITWMVKYTLIDKERQEYKVFGKAAYIDTLNYEYNAILIKISDTIEGNILNHLIE